MVISFLKELLSFRSITPNDAGSLEFIARFLPDFEAKFIEKNGTKNLILSKIYGDGEHLPLQGTSMSCHQAMAGIVSHLAHLKKMATSTQGARRI